MAADSGLIHRRDKANPAAAQGLPPVNERVPNVWRWSDIVWNVWASEVISFFFFFLGTCDGDADAGGITGRRQRPEA